MRTTFPGSTTHSNSGSSKHKLFYEKVNSWQGWVAIRCRKTAKAIKQSREEESVGDWKKPRLPLTHPIHPPHPSIANGSSVHSAGTSLPRWDAALFSSLLIVLTIQRGIAECEREGTVEVWISWFSENPREFWIVQTVWYGFLCWTVS